MKKVFFEKILQIKKIFVSLPRIIIHKFFINIMYLIFFNMISRFRVLAGILTCAVACGLSFHNSYTGYGVLEGDIHHQVLSQTNTGGGGGESGGDSGGESGGESGGCTCDGCTSECQCQSGGGSSGNNNPCPDYNYAAGEKIQAVVQSYPVTTNSNGEAQFGNSIKGGFAKNTTINVLVETKNCVKAESTTTCCDQRLVGSKIL